MPTTNLKTSNAPLDSKTQFEIDKQHAVNKQKSFCQPKIILQTTNLENKFVNDS